MLLVFVVVLAATYYFTKWMASYQKQKTSTGNIEVIETARLSATKYIQIVRIGDKYMAIAIGKDEVTPLCEVSREDLIIKEDSSEETLNFKEILEKFKSEKKK
jgi:flagellar protein FliO/FliZ